jgi:beta-hydroxylase
MNNNLQIIIISILVILSLIEILPFIITIIFPNLSYGSTKIGKLQQKYNNEYNLGYINWFAYLILFIYFIYLSLNIENSILRYSTILLCILFIYLPVYPIINIINMIMHIFYNNKPFIHKYHIIFPAAKKIEKSADKIINEFNNYNKNITCIRENNPGFTIENTTDESNCWRALYIKKMGEIDEKMNQHFPETIKLLEDPQIHNAFFSILDPGVEIPPHVGYYKGYLRYHLGVVIPTNDETNDKAYIICGGEKYIWKEKKGVVFDDLYLHHVKNPTNKTRVVLYLDVKRKSDNSVVNSINELGINYIENSVILKYFVKNQHNQIKIVDENN